MFVDEKFLLIVISDLKNNDTITIKLDLEQFKAYNTLKKQLDKEEEERKQEKLQEKKSLFGSITTKIKESSMVKNVQTSKADILDDRLETLKELENFKEVY